MKAHPTTSHRGAWTFSGDKRHGLATLGHCLHCGKVCYVRRKDAQQAKRAMAKMGRGLMGIYQCGNHWHIGHRKKVAA